MMLTGQSSSRHILVVDDDAHVSFLLQQLLLHEGHTVTLARDGVEALEILAIELPDLVLLDLDMPRLDGFEVCRQIKSNPRSRLLPVIILTGRGPSEARLRAWELGADDFLSKPFQNIEVVARCRSLLRIKDLVDQLDSAQDVVFALARTIEAKSRYTQGHTERVTNFSLALAARLGLVEPELEALRMGGALHDIGKIAVPDEILNKPGALTTDEYAIIKQHPLVGVRIVEPLHSVRDAVPLIRWHHERLDGQGYPDGLFGGAIPLLPRVLAVADVFDSLASERPYRAALPVADCLELLRANARSGGLDPELVRCFCEIQAAPLLPSQGHDRSPPVKELEAASS